MTSKTIEQVEAVETVVAEIRELLEAYAGELQSIIIRIEQDLAYAESDESYFHLGVAVCFSDITAPSDFISLASCITVENTISIYEQLLEETDLPISICNVEVY